MGERSINQKLKLFSWLGTTIGAFKYSLLLAAEMRVQGQLVSARKFSYSILLLHENKKAPHWIAC